MEYPLAERSPMNYENMMFVPSEPVPELKPSKEQLERLARALYPIIMEYYCKQEQDEESGNNKQPYYEGTIRIHKGRLRDFSRPL